MTDEEIYNYLQSLLPQGIVFVESYQTTTPVPFQNYVTMTTLGVRPVGLSQNRGVGSTEATVDVAYDLERVYKIQFDFYGHNAAYNSRVYQHNLEIKLREDKRAGVRLKQMDEIENLTEFLENKRFTFRYGFTVQLYVVDTIQNNKTYLTGAEISLVRAK